MTQAVPAVRSQVAPALVLVVSAFGAFLAFLDSTIVNVAFPSIQTAFPHSSFDLLSWVLNAYNIVFAAFLVAAGRIADLLGRRRMFMLGVAVFTLASAGCAAADSVGMLIAFRVLQALGAAVLVPASLAIVVEAFPPERRAHGIGLWGAAAALASGLGPPIGGALVQAQSWRMAFLVNVPLGVVAILVARRTLVESRAPGIRTVPDLRGAALLALALGSLTLGVVKGQDWGWQSVAVELAFAVALAALAGLIVSSRRHPSPILDSTLLRIRPFAVANLVTIVASMGFYAYLLTHILWLHYVWGYSLLKAGLAVAPGALVAAVAAGVLGRLADERGYRRIAVPGALIWAAGFAWYIWVVGTTPNFLAEWLPGQLISGLGVGATLPILASAALAAVPGGRYAGASAIVSSARQVGAVLGIAILVVIIGVPTATSAATVFRHGWVFCAICFLVAAAGAAFIGDGTAAEEAPELLAVEPLPAAGRPAKAAFYPFASVRGGGDTVPAAEAPLHDLPLFANLSEAAKARIEATANEVTVLAGELLFSAGDAADGLYVVRTGRLEIVRDGIVVQELGRGSTIGELGVLTGSPRAATVRAKRDSHLLRLTSEQFDELSATEPLFLRTISATVAGWLQAGRATSSGGNSRAAVVAIVALDVDAPVAAVVRVLADGVRPHLTVVAPGRLDGSGLERAEAAHDRVLLGAGVDDPTWRSFCLRQADRVVLVSGCPGAPPDASELAALGADLVLVGSRVDRARLTQWCDAIGPRTVYQADGDRLAEQLRPLAARIAGRSIGLVLSGGGARALAHIGVLEELESAGVVIDRIAGASFGALIGAMYATGLSPQEIDAVCYDGLVRRNPLNDYTVPVRGLARGAKLAAALQGFFGERIIEELPREFCPVSVDLLAREPVVHRRGRLADAINASVRLPGLFAPYPIGDRLHVDGGVMDNLPVSALTGRDEGPIIAVSISAGSGNSRRDGGPPRIPVLGDTLMRSMMVSSGATMAAALERADLVITPEARGVGLLEFHQLDQVRAAGRNAAREALRALHAQQPAPASDPVEARVKGPARPRPRPRPSRPVPAAESQDLRAGQSTACPAVQQ